MIFQPQTRIIVEEITKDELNDLCEILHDDGWGWYAKNMYPCGPAWYEALDNGFVIYLNLLREKPNPRGSVKEIGWDTLPCDTRASWDTIDARWDILCKSHDKKIAGGFNSTCPKCNAPAYIGFMTIECSRNCS